MYSSFDGQSQFSMYPAMYYTQGRVPSNLVVRQRCHRSRQYWTLQSLHTVPCQIKSNLFFFFSPFKWNGCPSQFQVSFWPWCPNCMAVVPLKLFNLLIKIYFVTLCSTRLADLGLQKYDVSELFVNLLIPSTFIIVFMVQLHYYHDHFLKMSVIKPSGYK